MEFFEIKRKIFEVEEKIGERSYRVSRNGKIFFLKDFENDKKRRTEIFNKYAKEFGRYNLIKLPPLEDNIPYCYPLCTNNKEILQKLSGKTILRLWDDIPKSFPEYEFLYNVASLLCR